jgi:hypothetical protein
MRDPAENRSPLAGKAVLVQPRSTTVDIEPPSGFPRLEDL